MFQLSRKIYRVFYFYTIYRRYCFWKMEKNNVVPVRKMKVKMKSKTVAPLVFFAHVARLSKRSYLTQHSISSSLMIYLLDTNQDLCLATLVFLNYCLSIMKYLFQLILTDLLMHERYSRCVKAL